MPFLLIALFVIRVWLIFGFIAPSMWVMYVVPFGLPPANGLALWGAAMTLGFLRAVVSPGKDTSTTAEKIVFEVAYMAVALAMWGLAALLLPHAVVGG